MMTTNGFTEAVGVFNELMQEVRRAAWFYYWLDNEFVGTDVDIRFCQEYETLYVISKRDPQHRVHISYDGRTASISHWKNFKDMSGLSTKSLDLVPDEDERYINDEATLQFMIEAIREFML